MPIIIDLENIAFSKKTILTIGTFDGIHLGHQIILKNLIEEAKQFGWRSALLTFEPHPQTVIRPERSPHIRILTTIDEKEMILEKLGLNVLIVAKFDQLLASLSGEEFIQKILLDKIGMSKCVIGHDHAFGKNRSGNFELMKKMSLEGDYEVEQIETFTHDGMVVKSTLIRNLIKEGHVDQATQLLGRPYRYHGTVVKGDGRGRNIGYPTANISGHPLKLKPKSGIYACRISVNGRNFNAVTNIGTRPTFKDEERLLIEVHILDFNDDLYNSEIGIEFLYRIRDERKFNSIDELQKQIEDDIKTAKYRGFALR
jgi:riboflavin kinase/FMN adenylyltransferase